MEVTMLYFICGFIPRDILLPTVAFLSGLGIGAVTVVVIFSYVYRRSVKDIEDEVKAYREFEGMPEPKKLKTRRTMWD